VLARERPSRLVVLGHPIAHSLSPAFQNAALEHLGIPLRYERMDVPPEGLVATMKALARERAGGNVTIPHKEAVAALARCSELAERVGAVNTFWHDDGTLVGHNTDVAGVMASIRSLLGDGLRQIHCAVLGAGGSAAAVLVALNDMGCESVAIAARAADRGRRLIDRLGVVARITQATEDAVAGAGLVINTTPIGMNDDDFPVAIASMPRDAAVIDLVYRRDETAWVRAARAQGHRAVDGRDMLLEQGAAAFECWFGVTAPRAVMREALSKAASALAS
jgi:shikimate dehydrogenase